MLRLSSYSTDCGCFSVKLLSQPSERMEVKACTQLPGIKLPVNNNDKLCVKKASFKKIFNLSTDLCVFLTGTNSSTYQRANLKGLNQIPFSKLESITLKPFAKFV